MCCCYLPAQDPWSASAKYGVWTTYFFLALFIADGIYNAFNSLDTLNRSAGLPSVFAIPGRMKAVIRSMDERKVVDSVPEVGIVLLALAFAAFSLAVCFGIRPYYRPPNFGSSPLCVRIPHLTPRLRPSCAHTPELTPTP